MTIFTCPNCGHKYSLNNICCRCNYEVKMKCPGHDVEEYYKDWEDDIPWDCLIDEIKWVARDEDGWFGFAIKPWLDDKFDIWVSGDVLSYNLNALKIMPKGPDDWKEAIAGRPE
jgi:hypothetical protein